MIIDDSDISEKHFEMIYTKNSIFYCFYPPSMPFNWRTPFGFIFAFCVEVLVTLCMTHLVICNVELLIRSIFILMTFADEVKQKFTTLGKNGKSEELHGEIPLEKNNENVGQSFKQFIDLHGNVKQLSKNYATVKLSKVKY